MSAYEDLVGRVRDADAMRQVLDALEREPVAVLYAICKEYERSGELVPDHHLRAAGYWKDVSLRALLAAGLVERRPGGRHSVYAYIPIGEGMSFYRRLVEEGWVAGRR